MVHHVHTSWQGLFVLVAAAASVCCLSAEIPAEVPGSQTEAAEKDAITPGQADSQSGPSPSFRGFIPQTGNPKMDWIYRQAYQDEYRAWQRRQMDEFERKLREKQKVWQGTTAELSRHACVTDLQRKSAAPFIELFETDPPAPKVRREYFAPFLKPDSPDRCVGWRLFLKSAKAVDDGWLVHLEAHTNLLGGGLVICFSSTSEIWHVSREGELTFVEGSPGEDEPARVNARL